MHRLSKLLPLFLFLFTCVLLFTACDLPPVEDAEIQSEIEEQEDFDKKGLKVTSFEESSRATDQKNGTDEITVKLEAESDYIRYTATYKVEYEREDDEWVFDKLKVRKSTLEPQNDPSDELLVSDLSGELQHLLGENCPNDLKITDRRETDSTNNEEDIRFERTYAVEYTGTSDLLELTGSGSVSYELDLEKGWVSTAVDAGYYECKVSKAPDESVLTPLLREYTGTGPQDEPLKLPDGAKFQSAEPAIEKIEINGDGNSFVCVYEFDTDDIFENIRMKLLYTYMVSFDLERGWQVDDGRCDLEDVDMSDLLGTWEYENGNNRITLIVKEISDDSVTVNYGEGDETASWSLHYLEDGNDSYLIFETDWGLIDIMEEDDWFPTTYELQYWCQISNESDFAINGFIVSEYLLTKISDSTDGEGECTFGSQDEEDPLAAFEGEPVGFHFYSANWEAWGTPNYYWHACMSLKKNEKNFAENVGTEDYEYRWWMSVREADTDNEWWTTECQLDTTAGTGQDDTADIIYRLQTGLFYDGKFEVGKEYECVVQVSDKDGNMLYKPAGLMWFVWNQNYQDDFDQWKTGHNADGTATSWIPSIPEHGNLTPSVKS